MSGFSGEFRHTIDANGRLSIPSRFLRSLGDAFHILAGTDGCLNVYPKQRLEQLEAEIEQLPRDHARLVRRKIYSMAQSCQADSQGRIVLEKPLREHAGLAKDVVFVGAGTYLELWNQETWSERGAYEHIVEPILRDLGV